MSNRTVNSAAVVANLLSTEGFTPFLANKVKQYWTSQICNPRAYKRMRHKKQAFSDLVKKKLDAGDRVILGKFVSLVEKMAFDTGIRIGIAAFMQGVRLEGGDVETHMAFERGWRQNNDLLLWEQLTDDDDNSYWEANSPYHIDGVPIKFRLCQKLIDNKVKWIEAHDSEITNDEWHDTLSDAMASCEEQAKTILKEIANGT